LALKARRAIDRPIASGLERHLSIPATLRTNYREHLLLAAFVAAAATIPTTAGTGVPGFLVSTAAIEATARFVGEALTGEKVLLTGGEREVSPTITAG
jgi:hypothetical protein